MACLALEARAQRIQPNTQEFAGSLCDLAVLQGRGSQLQVQAVPLEGVLAENGAVPQSRHGVTIQFFQEHAPHHTYYASPRGRRS